jgi:type III pantothenate kinase
VRALIVDAGNSRTVVVSWPGPEALPAPDAAPAALEVLARWERGAPGSLPGDDATPTVLVSVVPDETARLAAARPGLVVVDHRCDLPFALAVDEPAAVGPDRLANVAAACAAGLADALVVDAGTATTFDLLDGGRFLGGMIAPGMAFAARRLGEEAARLDPVPFGPAPWTVGANTRAALAGGSWHAGVEGIRGVIRGILERYGDRPVILTGGLGGFVDWPRARHDPDWTLRGAAFLGLSSARD